MLLVAFLPTVPCTYQEHRLFSLKASWEALGAEDGGCGQQQQSSLSHTRVGSPRPELLAAMSHHRAYHGTRLPWSSFSSQEAWLFAGIECFHDCSYKAGPAAAQQQLSPAAKLSSSAISCEAFPPVCTHWRWQVLQGEWRRQGLGDACSSSSEVGSL